MTSAERSLLSAACCLSHHTIGAPPMQAPAYIEAEGVHGVKEHLVGGAYVAAIAGSAGGGGSDRFKGHKRASITRLLC